MMAICSMRNILCLVGTAAGERRGSLQLIRLIYTQLWQGLMYAKSGMTIQETCCTVIGKMMEMTQTRNSLHKGHEEVYMKEILCIRLQREIPKRIRRTVVLLSRVICICHSVEAHDL